MKKKSIAGFFLSILIAELTGMLSGLLAGNIGAVYKTLEQPPLSPPGWLFPVVWIILYALMGIAAALVFYADADQKEKQSALILYAAQLFVNFLWSIIFFRAEWFWAAAVVILLLDLLVFLTILRFRSISRPAAWLMVPYLLWILFATYLNIGVALLN